MQGRLNDVNMLISAHLPRDPLSGRPTPEAIDMAQRVARYGRLISILFIANVAERFRPLCTEAGLRRLAQRGALTPAEVDLLLRFDPGSWPYVLTTWNIASVRQAASGDGVLAGAPVGLHQTLLERLADLRGTCASVEDDLAARMPVAYPQFVQVVVDSLLFTTAPAMVDKLGGAWAVLGAVEMTLFYSGMLELSKVFLDPFDSEEYGDKSLAVIRTDTFLSENHFLASRWLRAVEEPLPWEVRQAAPCTPRARLLQLARGHPLLAPLLTRGAPPPAGVLDGLEELLLERGETVIRQGEFASSMYLVVRGECLMSVNGQRVGTLGSGQLFGERALLEAAPRIATVEAARGRELSPCRRPSGPGPGTATP
ncbi:unnamed protein product [Prorocentrum cordatum]|uniref:Cyclic nucleotide-binding domain-containing protein n=2 Tax=Prorocentrum cordatum TaxID=2364126 RepID=A0ABN9RMQ2_9DINO|nr:unnamed protein product [Polarella glacialis]